jgi:cyclohexa-1,5-dienecarbonyl-CoA hydratase
MSAAGPETVTEGGVRVETSDDGALWRVVLCTPKANVLDADKIRAITRVFERARDARDLKAVLIDSDGGHFSFGASVEEHLPGRYEAMIPAFHDMFRRMLDASVVVLAAVRGQCLGGGLELASFAHRVFASPDAKLGQPEIVLGVIAPVASVVLPERIGRARAEELCIGGRIVGVEEAERIGLVDEVTEDPSAAARAWARKHYLPRSASSLRVAVRAARVGWQARFRDALAEVESIYLNDLMATRDAEEGLRAFVEKREPTWSNE